MFFTICFIYPPPFSASSGLERNHHPFTHKTRRIPAHKGVEFGWRGAAKISSNIGTYPPSSTSATPAPSGCHVVPLLINTISFVYHLCNFVGHSALLAGTCIACSVSPRLERMSMSSVASSLLFVARKERAGARDAHKSRAAVADSQYHSRNPTCHLYCEVRK
jgi:hypothetical protein